MSHGATLLRKAGWLNGRTTVVDSHCCRRCAGDSRTAIQRGVSVVQTPPAQKTQLLRPHAVDAGRKGGWRRTPQAWHALVVDDTGGGVRAWSVDSNLHERSQEAR